MREWLILNYSDAVESR